jgi:cobalt-zinc-cadmium resistance protein CzcA
LLPAAVASSIGAQAQQPLARVVVGGMVTTVFAILFIMPLLVRLFTSKGDLARELRNSTPEEI